MKKLIIPLVLLALSMVATYFVKNGGRAAPAAGAGACGPSCRSSMKRLPALPLAPRGSQPGPGCRLPRLPPVTACP